jgi:hypothetical protein
MNIWEGRQAFGQLHLRRLVVVMSVGLESNLKR